MMDANGRSQASIKLVIIGDSGVGKTSLRNQVRVSVTVVLCVKSLLTSGIVIVPDGTVLYGIQGDDWHRLHHEEFATL